MPANVVANVGRIVANQTVDVAGLGDVYERGRAFIAEAEQITPLFEYAPAPTLAGSGLAAFVEFYKDPAAIDRILDLLELARSQAYGPLE